MKRHTCFPLRERHFVAQIFPHLLIYRAWCFVNLAADFLVCNHTSFFSFAKSLSLHFLVFTSLSTNTFCVFPVMLVFSHMSSTVICLLQTCSLSVSLTLYPALFFVLFSSSPSYLFFLALALSHSTQTFHPVSPYLLLLLSGPPTVPVRPCCPIITSPSLSGCCPQCNCDRQAGSLSVIAHWTNTCQSEDPT